MNFGIMNPAMTNLDITNPVIETTEYYDVAEIKGKSVADHDCRITKMCAILQLVSAPLNPRPIADHFRRSHSPSEHSY